KNILFQQDDISWGPNSTFKFPLNGATGEIYRRIARRFPDKIHYNRRVEQIDISEKTLKFANGSQEKFDVLISAIPLNELVRMLLPPNDTLIQSAQKYLSFTSAMIVGIGLKGNPPPEERCWVYFPESNCPFYRVTYFHHYSPNNVPGKNYYSFMCETSYSDFRPINKSSIIDDTIDGLVRTGLITQDQRNNIVSAYLIDAGYSYPVPTLTRNKALSTIIPYLQQNQIYSRGRFGLWLYEVGNMDHSFVQGAEVVDQILLNKPEKVISPFKNILGL
ncbi:FAD-dependent oxidoreductase, partial [Candidatus Sumerlaeota bacterium]|nr:FAD-dependent oxidoreductase [Candidatus Sumerlaeota bacterium]